MSDSYRLGFSAARVAAIAITAVTAACGGGGGSSSGTGGGGGGTATYTVGGTVSGLTGNLVLQDNGADNLTVAANATSFTFATKVTGAYAVTVLTQPAGQTCTLAAASGTATGNVTNVAITCTNVAPNSFTVGGNVSGLTGTGLVLQDNGGDNLTVAPAAGGAAVPFTFKTPLANGAAYAVTVATQPTSPAENCTVSTGSGTISGANVTNVAISCTPAPLTVGGTVTGLTGTGLVLRDNGGDDLTVTAGTNGAAVQFTFKTAIAAGQNYAVTVYTQPTGPAQLCSVTSGGTGTVTAPVTNVMINCLKVGQFVFVANRQDVDLSAFTINPTTGALTAVMGSPFSAPPANTQPVSVAVDNTGNFVYLGNKSSASISLFLLNTDATAGPVGALTWHRDSSVTGTGPSSLVITPMNNFLIATGPGPNNTTPSTNAGRIYPLVLNGLTGAVSLSQGNETDLAYVPQTSALDPTGTFMFVPAPAHFLYAFTVSSVDGAEHPTAQTTGGAFDTTNNNVYGVAVWPGGTANGGFVYVSGEANGDVSAYSYDAAGALTAVGTPIASGSDTRGITIDPAGTYLYAANYAAGTVSSFSINAQTGALTAVAAGANAVHSGTGPINLKWDPSGQFLYVTNFTDGTVSVFTAKAGALTPVGTPIASGAGATGIAVY